MRFTDREMASRRLEIRVKTRKVVWTDKDKVGEVRFCGWLYAERKLERRLRLWSPIVTKLERLSWFVLGVLPRKGSNLRVFMVLPQCLTASPSETSAVKKIW